MNDVIKTLEYPSMMSPLNPANRLKSRLARALALSSALPYWRALRDRLLSFEKRERRFALAEFGLLSLLGVILVVWADYGQTL
jgi:hypothetical protein